MMVDGTHREEDSQGSDNTSGTDNEIEERYESMDDDEFFDALTQETAESAGMSAEELEDMSIHEFEDRADIDVEKPHYPRGSREGYKDSDRLKIVDKDEYESRRKRVREKLGIDP